LVNIIVPQDGAGLHGGNIVLDGDRSGICLVQYGRDTGNAAREGQVSVDDGQNGVVRIASVICAGDGHQAVIANGIVSDVEVGDGNPAVELDIFSLSWEG